MKLTTSPFSSYISNVTSEPKLMYVGHSMGTTALWVMSDLFPEFAANSVEVMVALAPVATLSNMASPVRLLSPFSSQVEVSIEGPFRKKKERFASVSKIANEG